MARIGTDTARLAISALILVLSLILLAGWTLKRPIGAPGHAGVGVVSGLANGAAVGGLPVAAFMAAQPIPAAVFRATMVAYLTAIDLIALPLMWHQGLVTADTALDLRIGRAVAAGLGIVLGSRHFLATTPQDFRRIDDPASGRPRRAWHIEIAGLSHGVWATSSWSTPGPPRSSWRCSRPTWAEVLTGSLSEIGGAARLQVGDTRTDMHSPRSRRPPLTRFWPRWPPRGHGLSGLAAAGHRVVHGGARR